jgi:hypothetical protein
VTQKEETTIGSFRLPLSLQRTLDVLRSSGVDPSLKTLSDVYLAGAKLEAERLASLSQDENMKKAVAIFKERDRLLRLKDIKDAQDDIESLRRFDG